jgi:hypothetical protein
MFTYHKTTTHPKKNYKTNNHIQQTPQKQNTSKQRNQKQRNQKQSNHKKELQKQGKKDINKTPKPTKPHQMQHYILQINHPRKKKKEKRTPKNNRTTILLKRKTPRYTYYNIKDILTCRDLKKHSGTKLTFSLNHPQMQHKIYFYKNTTQIKIKIKHIFKFFQTHLNHILIEITNPHLKQLCTYYQNKNTEITSIEYTTSNNAKMPTLLNQILYTTTTKISKQKHETTIKLATKKTPKHHETKKTYQHKHTHISKSKIVIKYRFW